MSLTCTGHHRQWPPVAPRRPSGAISLTSAVLGTGGGPLSSCSRHDISAALKGWSASHIGSCTQKTAESRLHWHCWCQAPSQSWRPASQCALLSQRCGCALTGV